MKKPIRVEWCGNYQEWAFLDPDNNWVGSIGTDSGTFDKGSEQDACEIVRAVNEHDDLIKERYALIIQRDKLIALRDALVKACEAWMQWYDAGMPRNKPTFIGVKTVHTNAPELTRDALAMVRGEVQDG